MILTLIVIYRCEKYNNYLFTELQVHKRKYWYILVTWETIHGWLGKTEIQLINVIGGSYGNASMIGHHVQIQPCDVIFTKWKSIGEFPTNITVTQFTTMSNYIMFYS